jgi:hypothetical protein
MRYNHGSAGQGVRSTASLTFGTWPTTFPAATIGNFVFSLFATFAVDVTRPTVTAVTPANGATGVSAATAVTATFSEAIDAATITPGTVVLRNPANAVVSASISYTVANHVTTLTPSMALAPSTKYTARIVGGSAGVKDTAGNALASDVVWSFTTTGATTTARGVTDGPEEQPIRQDR